MAPSCTLQDCVIDKNAGSEAIFKLLTLRGGIVIKGMVDPEDAVNMKKELQPYLDTQDVNAGADA